ncbi:MAG: hypothetical protein U0271_48350 [Polyangiaceae bacterium]
MLTVDGGAGPDGADTTRSGSTPTPSSVSANDPPGKRSAARAAHPSPSKARPSRASTTSPTSSSTPSSRTLRVTKVDLTKMGGLYPGRCSGSCTSSASLAVVLGDNTDLSRNASSLRALRRPFACVAPRLLLVCTSSRTRPSCHATLCILRQQPDRYFKKHD